MEERSQGPEMELTVQKMDDWREVARRLLDYAGPRRKFALYGEIGAGKTTLIQAVGQLLGVADAVTSPTFALANEYEVAGSGATVHHIDLYRLESVDEALQIGIEDFLYDAAYCFVEWPELIESLLPEEVVRIKITLEPDSSRKIVIL